MTDELLLARAGSSPDDEGPAFFATIKQMYADGTIDVDLGGNRILSRCLVRDSYTPQIGSQVTVRPFNQAKWIVEGGIRTTNPTTVDVGRSWAFPYNVTPAAPGGGVANPLVVSVNATGTYRSADGWGSSFLPGGSDTVGQGAYTTQYGYWQGCYFYGDTAFTSIAGRRCTRLRIKLIRLGSGGLTGATQQVVGTHPHGARPAGPPLMTKGPFTAGSLSWSTSGTFDLPVDWGQALIDNAGAKGIMHQLFATGNGKLSFCAGKTADGTTGQLTIDWA
jgi:hypothetical protein